MKQQACEPCAKRKVRCDREEPCSNCKRRKKDHCKYPISSPQDRIKELEAVVRNLGRDVTQIPTPSSITESIQGRQDAGLIEDYGSERLAILNEDGEAVYVERYAWQGYFNSDNSHTEMHTDMSSRNITATRNNQNAFERFTVRTDLVSKHPDAEVGSALWRLYLHRVDPLISISFRWELNQLKHVEHGRLTDAEHAYIFAIYLIAALSCSEEECISITGQTKSEAISHYQTACEDAMTCTSLFCVTDIVGLKALVVYITAGLDRLNTTSLWSLMGLVVRSAERMGLHRDGELLKLSPFEIERRRRLWWHLQQLDLILTIRAGISPLTLSADWDTKLPSNIEDEDISAEMTVPPPERKGLTSRSYNFFTYWVIDYQRKYSRNAGLSKSVLSPIDEAGVDELEDRLNKKFLQYCDPINAMDTFLQIMARALMALFRLRNQLPFANGAKPVAQHPDLIQTCRKSLYYYITIKEQSSMQRFRWATQAFFPWHAFMCILVDISQENVLEKVQDNWDLLSDMYGVNSNMFQLSEDRRRVQAAELIINAWKACRGKFHNNAKLRKYDFISQLEEKLAAKQHGQSEGREKSIDVADAVIDEEALVAFDFDFQDIDWSFWSSID